MPRLGPPQSGAIVGSLSVKIKWIEAVWRRLGNRSPYPDFADDFTRLRDGEPRSSEQTLSQASRKTGNAQCPAR